jgi:translation elongation factor aEF-1 beta
MGMVGITLHVMPESTEINIKDLKKQIEGIKHVREVTEKPIGFGLVKLDVLLVFDDKAGAGDSEDKIKSLHGVGSVESGDVTLIS